MIDESQPPSHDDGSAAAPVVATGDTVAAVIDESVPHNHGTAAAVDPATATVGADGAAVTETTAHDHGGAVEYDSEPGRTTFRVMLPMQSPQAAP